MSDNFLYQLRRSPRQEFAAELYGRISQEQKTPTLSPSAFFTRRRLALTVLCLACAATLMAFPTVRAAVGRTIRHLGGISVWETDQHPYLGGEKMIISPLQTVSLAEAQALLAGKVSLPGWVPDGFVLKDQVELYRKGYDHWSVVLTWENAANRHSIGLYADYLAQDFIPTEIVGIGSVEEVTVNGRPAALVRGAWNPTTKEWTPTGLVHLHWSREQVV